MMPRRRILALVVAGISILLAACILALAVAFLPSAVSTHSAVGASKANLFSNRFGFSSAQAAPLVQATEPPPQSYDEDQLKTNMSIGNETCLQCHSQPTLNMSLEDGELLSLYIPQEIYDGSIHGQQGYACVQCHTTVGNYPHPPFSATDARDASLQLYQACRRCHSSLYELTQDSVHAAALEAGNRNAAICTDCHTAHAVRQLTDPESGELLSETRVWIPQTCAQCHYAIYQKYSTSVHGSALLGEGNPDVPTCIDCHGVHNIENPTTAAFRLKSPEICAKCHTDPSIMDKYGISTQVLNTYVADFHGTTVTLFEKQAPDQETNKPVCFDCHGVHDIKRVDDPVEGLRIKENLLARCQVCHPDATANFPDAWLSHYIPSPEKNTLVFLVDQFYKFFIPTVLGGMAVLVVLDVSGLIQRLRKRGKNELEKPEETGEFPWDQGLTPAEESHPQTGIVSADPAPDVSGEISATAPDIEVEDDQTEGNDGHPAASGPAESDRDEAQTNEDPSSGQPETPPEDLQPGEQTEENHDG